MENSIESEDAVITKKFPAISVTLDEIRRLYDMEDGRRIGLENKAGMLSGVIGVIFTIISAFEQRNTDALILIYMLLIIALLFSLRVIRLTKQKTPHKKYDDFYQYASMGENEATDRFLLNYINAALDMEKKNNQKVVFLQISFILTIASWICMILINPLISFF